MEKRKTEQIQERDKKGRFLPVPDPRRNTMSVTDDEKKLIEEVRAIVHPIRDLADYVKYQEDMQ